MGRAKGKKENTFKFKSFIQLIEEVQIVSLRRNQKRDSNSEDNLASLFGESVRKWTELNCTQHFVEFRQDVGKDIETLQQVILHQKSIIDCLERHLGVPNSLALEPLIDLIVPLARDLQEDFYNNGFEDIFKILIKLLDQRHHDVNILQQIFVCLSNLFKFLSKLMSKNIKKVFRLFSPLLSTDNYKEYIHCFAAEAFSYIMRKVENKSQFFDFLFKKLRNNPDLVEGVGRLLFEMVRGIQQQFHSQADEVIRTLLDKLTDVKNCEGGTIQSLCHMWRLMAQYTSSRHSLFILQAMITKLTDVSEKWEANKVEGCEFQALLQLLIIWIEQRYGELIQNTELFVRVEPRNLLVQVYLSGQVLNINPINQLVQINLKDFLVQMLEKLLRGRQLPEDGREVLLQTVATLLLADRCDLNAHHRPMLLRAVYRSNYTSSEIFNFTRSIFRIRFFEQDVIEFLLEFCHGHTTDSANKVLHVLTSLLVQKLQSLSNGPQSSSPQSSTINTYNLNFSRFQSPTFPEWVVAKLEERSVEVKDLPVSLPDLWAMLYCLPHLAPIDQNICVRIVSDLLPMLLCMAKAFTDNVERNRVLYILRVVVSGLAQLSGSQRLIDHVEMKTISTMIRDFPANEDCLEAIDLYLKEASGSLLTEDLFAEFFPHLKPNLSSPYTQIRLITLQIVNRFKLTMPNSLMMASLENVFQVCLAVESTPATVKTDKERIMHLQKLNFEYVASRLPVGLSEQVPLQFLIGQLHINFEKIWDPVSKLISIYANGLKLNQFWEIFEIELQNAATNCELQSSQKPSSPEDGGEDDGEDDSLVQLFHRVSEQAILSRNLDRPNFASYRDRLWTAMHLFPRVCEQRSKIVVPIFFSFLDNEYHFQSNDCNVTSTQDLRLNPEEDLEDSDDEEEKRDGDEGNVLELTDGKPADESMEVETRQDNNQKRSKPKNKSKKSLLASSSKSFLTHLRLFSLFNDPRSVIQQKRLKGLYRDLLMSNSNEVQKVAFDCLMTYKLKYLVPYREILERLIDEKTFNNELILFSLQPEGLDPQNATVRSEHRTKFVEILMRIIYGKLKMKVGKNANGRAQGLSRKNKVLEFIAKCDQQEIAIFLDLMFLPFKHYLSDDLLGKVTQITAEIDPAKVIPLRKQRSVLSTIDMVYEKLGSLIESYLPKLLQLVVCIGASCNALLSSRGSIAAKSVMALKKVRQDAQMRIMEFFDQFEGYLFTTNEIDAVFDAIVWPQVENLPIEGISHPTMLLKLFLAWSKNPRYHTLLGKCSRNDPKIIAFSLIIDLLLVNGVSKTVSGMILDIIENLLTITLPDPDEEEIIPVDPGSMWKLDCEEFQSRPYGTSLVLVYTPGILSYLGEAVKVMGGGKKKAIPARELNILSRLSEFVTDSESSEKVIRQLLQLLSKNLRRNQDTEVDILKTIRNLIAKTNEPSLFFKQIAFLFNSLSNNASRTELCNVVKFLAEKETSMKDISKIVEDLNSWDPRHLEEPDFKRRMDGFDKASELISSASEIDEDLVMILIHNCMYFLASLEDFPLRDRSLRSVEEIIEKVAKADDKCQTSMLRCLMPEVKKGLKLKTELFRNGFINILSLLVQHMPTVGQFESLTFLRDTEDVEKDFFQNITHIQMHRRSRALKRLAKQLRTKNARIYTLHALTAYIMPIVVAFFRDETYAKNSDLLDAAVEALGAVAMYLPWESYLSLLHFYLRALVKTDVNQKLVVRILVALLDNFHFDLQNSRFSLSPEETSAIEKSEAAAFEASIEKMEEEVEEETTDAVEEESNKAAVAGGDIKSIIQSEVKCEVVRATHIHKTIMTSILPVLHKCLTHKTKSDDQHKLAVPGKYAEDEEILRVPIALAMVKMLQALPKGGLEKNLPSIVLKVCYFLGSRAQDIRNTARETLKKILLSIGSKYFLHILVEMRSHLHRGYQLHVLCFTIWSLLMEMKKKNKEMKQTYACEENQENQGAERTEEDMEEEIMSETDDEMETNDDGAKNTTSKDLKKEKKADKRCFLRPGDLDNCVTIMTEIFQKELFGDVAEEKEVSAIASKLFEARTTKSIDSYGILASFVTDQTLPKLILPLKEVLEDTLNEKSVSRVTEVLEKISQGLYENSELHLPVPESGNHIGSPRLHLNFVMMFIYGLTSDSLEKIADAKVLKSEKPKHDPRLQPQSKLLIETAPPRGGKKPKADSRANLYVLVEFGFNLLGKFLSRSMLVNTNKGHLEMLDPFVTILKNSLSSNEQQRSKSNRESSKVKIAALKCITGILRFPLPTLKTEINAISDQLFVLLQSNSSSNLEITRWCSQAVRVLVQFVHDHNITTDQLRVLLTYAEQHLLDDSRDATAFPLLFAVMSRKLVDKSLHKIIITIEDMSVRSQMNDVQRKCRNVAVMYLTDYPINDKEMGKHVKFYVDHMSNYEHESGRQSALQMIERMINTFPKDFLTKYHEEIFIPLALRWNNEESNTCTKLITSVMKLLLEKLGKNERDQLLSLCFDRWMNKNSTLIVAAVVIGIFVDVEKQDFDRRLDKILPILHSQLAVDRYEEVVTSDKDQQDRDHVLFHYLNLLLKILDNCDISREPDRNIIRIPRWTSIMNQIWECVQSHLKYDYDLVQLRSAQLFGRLFSSWDPADLVSPDSSTVTSGKKKRRIEDEKKPLEYLQIDFDSKLHGLCGSFCFQLSAAKLRPDLATEISRNLLFLARILMRLPKKSQETVGKESSPSASLPWLMKELIRKMKKEWESKLTTIKRRTIFVWMGALAEELGPEQISDYLDYILRPLIRELNDNSPTAEEELKTLAQEVLKRIQEKAGNAYKLAYAKQSEAILDKKRKNKERLKTTAVENPELHARKKMQKNLAKKAAKKRKIYEFRPTKVKRRKTDHHDGGGDMM